MQILKNFNLKSLNTFHIDVITKFFAECSDQNDIIACLNDKRFIENDRLIIGGGSNILFRNDFDGFVLKPNIKGIHAIEENDSEIIIQANNGEVWDNFVKYCVENHYQGIENLSWIPGNVGAVAVQNIGAYGVEVKDIIIFVEALKIDTNEIEIFSNKQCEFTYRGSIFKNSFKDKYIIISVTFKLSKKTGYNYEYKALQDELNNFDKINLENIRQAIINIRKSKLPDPDEFGNCGSFFKNPVVDFEKFNNIYKKNIDMPFYKISNDEYKIPAGWLIEKCDWKGKRVGNVGTYNKQALIIVNYGNASGEELYQLSQKIKSDVNNKFGIILEEEVNIC